MKIGVLFVNALCLLSVFNEGKNDLEVETTNGLIEGSQYQWSDGSVVNSWRGIPFAQPPVGDLRWRSPVDHGKWNGTLNCKKLKTSCIQPGGDGKEDCLYLNVYSTANPKNKGPFPVLFYIYGGSLMGGAANSDYGGFVSHAGNGEGIVVVEVSYRLNIFGFLASSELSQEQGGVSGNYGIQDQIHALQWTKDNIANFNGDPNLVTICGQSSGGTSVFALLAAPASRGLYQRAISLSGSPNITLSMDAAERQNEGIITQSGCSKPGFTPAQIVSCMRDMGTKALVALIPEAWNTPHLFDLPMAVQGEGWEGLVIVDGHTITQPYDIALHLGDVSSNVPFMVGAMGQEPDEWPDHNFQGLSPEQWRDYLVGAFAPWDEVRRAKNVSIVESVGEEVFRLYAADSPQKAFDSIVSDYGQSCATLQIARQARPPLGKYAADIFMFVNQYHLSTPFNTTPEYTVRHASHVYDLFMAMETWQAFDSDISGPYVPDARDLAGSALLQRLWYAFMRTGNPTPEGENNTDSRERMTQWKPVDRTKDWPASYNTYVIRSDGNAHSETVENYNREKCDLFAEIGVSQKQFWWCN